MAGELAIQLPDDVAMMLAIASSNEGVQQEGPRKLDPAKPEFESRLTFWDRFWRSSV